MRPLSSLSLLLATVLPANALYFYMDSHIAKCFYEELPKDTVISGHYSTSVLNTQTHNYEPGKSPIEIGIKIFEIFDADHRVFNTRNPPDGKFTFTAADSGEHRICFEVYGAPSVGWLSGGQPQGAVRFTLDLAMGDTDEIHSGNNSEMDELASKVRDLNSRLESIKKEQVHQREREAEFRTMSEAVNSRLMRWSLVQLAVLGVTCAWQLSHLRSFFIKQKLT